MLRIDIQQTSEATSFTVAGKLSKPWVGELERCWQELASSQACKSVSVNLAAVTFVDATGKELLTEMRRRGVVLIPTGCLMKAIVEEIEDEVKAPAVVER